MTTRPTERLCNEYPVAVRLTPEELEQARNLAAAEGRAAGNFVRQVYRTGLPHYLASQSKPVDAGNSTPTT